MGYCFAFSGACPEALSSGAEAARCLEILLAGCNMRNCKPTSKDEANCNTVKTSGYTYELYPRRSCEGGWFQ